MNKPILPRDAEGAADATDTPKDLGQTGTSRPDGADQDDAAREHQGDERPETDVADADESSTEPPRHDILDLRAPDPKKGDDDKRPDDGKPKRGEGATENRNEAPEGRRKSGDEPAEDRTNKPDETKPDEAKPGEAKPEDGQGKSDEPPPKAPPKSVFIGVAVVLLLCLAWGAWSHWRSYSASKQVTSDTVNRPVEVRTVASEREDGPTTLTLPGETDAFDTASIYARATGYISVRKVDIGTRVKAGDLLVHIAAPDLDNQLAQAVAQLGQTQAALTQARAQVDQAEANVNLAKVTFARTNQLTQQGYESQQNRDNQQANVQVQQANVEAAKAGVTLADANVRAQQATVDRLRALTGFEDVRAPFDGVITSRTVDVGDLVNADSSTGSPMFTIEHDTVVRVTVRVPQNSATGMLDGLQAKVLVPQMPDRPFVGRVARTSQALLYSSRSLTAEVDVPNPDGTLRSGLYVTAAFKIPRENPAVLVPAEALIFNQLGLQVATVQDDKVKLHNVTIYRDFGTTVELREGLEGGEHVVLSPPATLAENAAVKETFETNPGAADTNAQKPDKQVDDKKQGDKGDKGADQKDGQSQAKPQGK